MAVVLLEPGLLALLELPSSPVSRYVTLKAEATAQLARENVQANFRSRTGNLERSIGTFPAETPDGLEVEVGTEGAPYGRVLELGASPHPILPTQHRVLISEPQNPDPLLGPRRRVDHPGNPPRPWLKPALETVFNGG